METRIPIYNLYYLLCYAWDRLEERDLVDVSSTTPPRDALNLLGRVLVNGVRALVRRGFERGYSERRDELTGMRGKLILTPTVRRQLPFYGRAECTFDELEHDTRANRIILSVLTRLMRSPSVEDSLRREAGGLCRRFKDVPLVHASVADCHRVMMHRNNRHYGFLVDLCEFILRMVIPDEQGAVTWFRDFSRDHQAMARLFEDFVRQFYIHHATECGLEEVSRRQIPWAGEAENERSREIWPTMNSDICVRRHAATPLVIDCKFYAEALKESWYGKQRLGSSLLYQIFTYTQNLAAVPGWEDVEGLLLYAENDDSFDVARSVCGRRIRAVSLDLDRPWPEIHNRLVALVSSGASAYHN